MPRSSGLSRSMSRWAFHVSSSVGATLIAALLVQAFPRPAADVPAAAPALTSGGKFAARVASTEANDGLDTMPLPRIAPARPEPAAAIVPVAFPLVPPAADAGFAVRPPVFDGTPVHGRVKVAKIPRMSASPDMRRAAADTPVASAEGGRGAPAEPVAQDGGLLDQVVARTRQVWSATSATTRAAWTTTTSTGSALIAHVVP